MGIWRIALSTLDFFFRLFFFWTSVSPAPITIGRWATPHCSQWCFLLQLVQDLCSQLDRDAWSLWSYLFLWESTFRDLERGGSLAVDQIFLKVCSSIHQAYLFWSQYCMVAKQFSALWPKGDAYFFFFFFFLSTYCWYSESLTFEERKVFLEVLIHQMSIAAVVQWKLRTVF